MLSLVGSLQKEASLVMKLTIALTLVLWFCGCRKTPEPTPEPKPQEKPKIQSFVSPTAEQAYRLQDDCTKRGEKILADATHVIGVVVATK